MFVLPTGPRKKPAIKAGRRLREVKVYAWEKDCRDTVATAGTDQLPR